MTIEEQEYADEEKACITHPCAPHGFNRNASHAAHRYVCDCEGWCPEQGCAVEQLCTRCKACNKK